MANIKIYIPSFIGSINYDPVRTLPRLYFYNGLVACQPYFVEGYGYYGVPQTAFPYVDHYDVVSGSFPTTGSHSLLFNNEEPVYGSQPLQSLYSEYWSKYVELLYNPYTRLFEASAIIPLADYADLYLNDIIEWRGNYYHLRAINNYSVKTGECNIQLLGPILGDALDFINGSCNFAFNSSTITTTTTTAGPTTTTTTFSSNPCDCLQISVTSAGGEIQILNCFGANENIVYASAGTYNKCVARVGGLAQITVISGTITWGPVGNCKTAPCPPTPPTTTTTAGPTTTTTSGPTTTTTSGPTTTTTTLAPGDYTYFNAVACVDTSSVTVMRAATSLVTLGEFGTNWTYFDLGTKKCMTTTGTTTQQAVSMTISNLQQRDQYVFGNNNTNPGQCARCLSFFPTTGSCYTATLTVQNTGDYRYIYYNCSGVANDISGSATGGTTFSLACSLNIQPINNIDVSNLTYCNPFPQ